MRKRKKAHKDSTSLWAFLLVYQMINLEAITFNTKTSITVFRGSNLNCLPWTLTCCHSTKRILCTTADCMEWLIYEKPFRVIIKDEDISLSCENYSSTSPDPRWFTEHIRELKVRGDCNDIGSGASKPHNEVTSTVGIRMCCESVDLRLSFPLMSCNSVSELPVPVNLFLIYCNCSQLPTIPIAWFKPRTIHRAP